MRVFLDDSGTDTTGECCVLAGFIADDVSWASFSNEWRAALASPPGVSYFKMREAESMRGQCRGWSRPDRNKKLLDLATVIKANVAGAVFSVVKHCDYETAVRGRLPRTVDNPYWVCFLGVVLSVVAQYGGAEKVDFVLDTQGEGYERRAHTMFSSWHAGRLESRQQVALGDISFANDFEVLPIQAADMLAWHLRRRADRLVAGLEPEDRPIGDLLHEIPTSGRFWQADILDIFVRLYHELHPNSPRNS